MKLPCDPATCPHDCLGLGYCVRIAGIEREIAGTLASDRDRLNRAITVFALAIVLVICVLLVGIWIEDDDDGRDEREDIPDPPPPDGETLPAPPRLEPEVEQANRRREAADA